MKKIFAIILGILVLSFGAFFLIRVFGSTATTNNAVLKVYAVPSAAVFLNNQHIGKTPFEEFVPPGEYTLKLVPESSVEDIQSWEGTVVLTQGLLTFVNRELDTTELASAGEILTLEKVPSKKAEVVVVSAPDGATVTIDGVERGVTPLALEDIQAGEHEITVSALGSISRTIKVRVSQGFKLTASFQLAISDAVFPEKTPEPSPSTDNNKTTKKEETTTTAGVHVEILDTPTGFLRVREKPTTNSSESARVKPGETYPFLDEDNGWLQIELEEGASGWVSGQYAEKVTE